jgi:hypothetical protein
MVIGTYVGVATIYGFVWYHTASPRGARLSWGELTAFQHCVEGQHR